MKIVCAIVLLLLSLPPACAQGGFVQQAESRAVPQGAAGQAFSGTEIALRLLGIAASWPIIFLLLVTMFRRELRLLLPELARRITKLPGGIELDDTKKLYAFTEAAHEIEQQVKDPSAAEKQLAELTKKVVDAVRFAPAQESGGTFRILWVDDNPLNNRFEAGLLENLGALVTYAQTTEEALTALKNRHFDVVISDIYRIENGIEQPEAGYNLLERIRKTELPSR